jgi:hypothetical protein
VPDKFRTNAKETEQQEYWVHNYWQGSSETDDGLNHLTNTRKYYPVYSFSCNNAAYDPNVPEYSATDTCIADAFVDAYGSKGGCAYLGCTRAPQAHFFDMEDEYYKLIFNTGEDSCAKIGFAEAHSKLCEALRWNYWQDRQTIYCHNLFGSPHTEAWTKTPGSFNVSHPTRINRGVWTNFTVTVKDGASNPVQYAKVCLNKPGDIYKVGETNSQGKVTFRIRPATNGTMKVTVTRPHNLEGNYKQYLPSQTTCQVSDMPKGGGQTADSDNLAPRHLCFTGLSTIVHGNIKVKFGIPKEEDMTITIYNVIGVVVKKISTTGLKPGYYEQTIETKAISNGIYFVMLKQDKEMVTKKIIVMK